MKIVDILSDVQGLLLVFLLFVFIVLFSYFVYDTFRPAKITEGRVIEKVFKPAGSSMVMTPVNTGKTTILIPHYYFYPKRWYVIIEENEKKEKFYIKEDIFNKINIGDYFEAKDATRKERSLKYYIL